MRLLLLSVRTTVGHPFAGWRGWEVTEDGDDIIIQTYALIHEQNWVDTIKQGLDHYVGGADNTWDDFLTFLAADSGGVVDHDSEDTNLGLGYGAEVIGEEKRQIHIKVSGGKFDGPFDGP